MGVARSHPQRWSFVSGHRQNEALVCGIGGRRSSRLRANKRPLAGIILNVEPTPTSRWFNFGSRKSCCSAELKTRLVWCWSAVCDGGPTSTHYSMKGSLTSGTWYSVIGRIPCKMSTTILWPTLNSILSKRRIRWSECEPEFIPNVQWTSAVERVEREAGIDHGWHSALDWCTSLCFCPPCWGVFSFSSPL